MEGTFFQKIYKVWMLHWKKEKIVSEAEIKGLCPKNNLIHKLQNPSEQMRCVLISKQTVETMKV